MRNAVHAHGRPHDRKQPKKIKTMLCSCANDMSVNKPVE